MAYNMVQDISVQQVRGFANEYGREKRRIEELTAMLPHAQESGGILTISLEALQDDQLRTVVSPDVIVPYIQKELEHEKLLLAESERKMRQVLEIINS
jgi:hypothetical protein